MSASSSTGESSSRQQENGDVVTGTDRPLKKARFAWQVKGKHHLKTEKVNDVASPVNHTEAEKLSSSSDSENDSMNEPLANAEQNLEILGDYLLKTDFNTIDSVINDTKGTAETPVSEIQNTSNISNNNNNRTYTPVRVPGESFYRNHGIRPVVADPVNECEHLARWQARQVAKGFVDNTINRVLESWMETPMPSDINSGLAALDVANFINSLPGHNTVEDEGILMAISAHGLQNASSVSDDNSSDSATVNAAVSVPPESPTTLYEKSSNALKPENSTKEDLPKNEGICSNRLEADAKSCDKKEPEKEETPEPQDECSSSNYENKTSKKRRKKLKQNKTNTQSTFYDELVYTGPLSDNEDLLVTFAQQESLRISHLPIFCHENEEEDMATHLNFMEAAVSFAIQNNGLSSYGTNFG